MSEIVLVALLVYISPFTIAAVAGLWLALLSQLGLPSLLQQLRVPTSIAQRVIRFIAPAMSWGGAAAVLAIYYLAFFGATNMNPWKIVDIDNTTANALVEWWFLTPLVWSVLAIEGAVTLIIHFGLPAFLEQRGGTVSYERITRYTVNTMLIVGILTGLIGIGWPIRTAFVDPESLWGHTKLGHSLSPLLVCFCPMTLVFMACLSNWLKTASNERIKITKGIVTAVVIASSIGGILSALYGYRQ